MNKQMTVSIPGVVALPDSKTHAHRMNIKSETSNRLYVVAQARSSNEWQCSCPGWIYKKPGQPRKCKHLTSMMPMLEMIASGQLEQQAA